MDFLWGVGDSGVTIGAGCCSVIVGVWGILGSVEGSGVQVGVGMPVVSRVFIVCVSVD